MAFEEACHNFGDLRLAETENAYLQELTKRTERVSACANDGLSMLRRRFAVKDPQCKEAYGESTQAAGYEADQAVTGQRPASIRGIRT